MKRKHWYRAYRAWLVLPSAALDEIADAVMSVGRAVGCLLLGALRIALFLVPPLSLPFMAWMLARYERQNNEALARAHGRIRRQQDCLNPDND